MNHAGKEARANPMKQLCFSMTLASALIASVIHAAEVSPAMPPPQGVPANPKVDARFDRFYDYGQATKLLKDLAAAHPKFANLQSLGKSFGGNEIWLLTLTDSVSGPAQEKPAMWIDGGIHGNEVQSVEAVLYTAWFLLEMRQENERVAKSLKERTFYLLPTLSPDSRDKHFYEPNSPHSPRSGQRPVDDDRDGLVDEDGPDDLDGDGQITLMRVKDPGGDYKDHPKYAGQMTKVENGEAGQYRVLGVEGIDNDGDGKVNEDGDGAYDPNRNWPWQWQPEYVQGGAHRYPLSIDENRLAAEFIIAHPNIIGAQSYHNAGGMILRGPGVKDKPYEKADESLLKEISDAGAKMLPGYKPVKLGEELYAARGVEIDWLYNMRGVYAFTNELFSAHGYFDTADDEGFFGSEVTRQEFNEKILLGGGYAKWTPADHPTYGKIEVGGMKKNFGRQPPSFMLREELHRNMAFTLHHAQQLPLVKIDGIEVKDLGGVQEVTVAVRNERLLPTRAAVDVKHKITAPDILDIAGENLHIHAGLIDDDPCFGNPKDARRTPQRLRIDRVPGRGAIYARWLVSGDGEATVTFRSVKGGRAKRSVTLP